MEKKLKEYEMKMLIGGDFNAKIRKQGWNVAVWDSGGRRHGENQKTES